MGTTPRDAGILFDSGRMFYGRLPRAIIGGTFILLAGSLLAAFATGALRTDPSVAVLLGGAAAFIGILGFGFSRIQVRENEVRLRWFPFYRRRIPVTAIRRATPAAIHGLRYGFGLRFGAFGLGIIQDTGPAVQLDSGHGYLLSLGNQDRQERFLSALAASGVDIHRP
ncbi:hypothetical protein FCN77_00520 [Arthrobacter sp. 24S4-2]|uniref:hypothetical protein n=1 Tax=Arthrobacter sp. 24S4-2 TaxID=2575374 RepID=UPI0010C7A3ED|nr:hypothetical protein [Arthrobacter sp. 24S4-2]QCO96473.1 hypothetical protein FCN77_00520 [Arthrobacter sp. 24S4-2]